MIRITFLDGEEITWNKNQYTSYSFDSRTFVIKKGNKPVGIYNMNCIKEITVDV